MKPSIVLMLFVAMLFSCTNETTKEPIKKDNVDNTMNRPLEPDWAKNANIYEVNIRQFTEEGTFNAFVDNHLERLHQMGVDILWLMPVYPISVKKRKGTLGSYYAISDYKAVNPEFGTEADLKNLITKAHEKEMKVILDFVPNHTGWDCTWIEEHPEWYTRDSAGNVIHPPNTDWTDIADLEYEHKGVREAVKDAMVYWVKNFDTDGYRIDVAGMVATDFFEEVRPELDAIKPVFMLAEWEDKPEHFNKAFNMNYAWTFKNVMTEVFKGEKNVDAIDDYLEVQTAKFPAHYYQMYFTTNHDENSWNNYPMLFGDAEKAFTTLAFTLSGMPLIYTGQEAGFDKAVEFFEKDAINWGNIEHQAFFTTLLKLKHENKALWNGLHGGKVERIKTANDKVYAFKRVKEGNEVLVVLNLGGEEASTTLAGDAVLGDWTTVFSEEKITITAEHQMTMKPWAFSVWTK